MRIGIRRIQCGRKIYPKLYSTGHNLNVGDHEMFDGFRCELDNIGFRSTRDVPVCLEKKNFPLLETIQAVCGQGSISCLNLDHGALVRLLMYEDRLKALVIRLA